MNNTTILTRIGSFCLIFFFSIMTSWAQCQPPTGITISAIDQISARIDWTASASPDIEEYESELRTSGAPFSGADGLVSSFQSSATFVQFDGLDSSTEYFFYIKSICTGDVGTWSPAFPFTTLDLDAPVAIEPSNISSISFVARWEAVSGATQYKVEVTTDDDFSQPIYIEELGDVLNRLIPGLSLETDYQYRVFARTSDTGAWSAASNTVDVTTTSIAPTVAIWTSTGWSAEPTEFVDLQIKANFNTSISDYGSTLVGKSLTLFAPFKFTIAAGTYVIVGENIDNQSGAANFVQESNSNLNQKLGTPNLGEITVHRNSFPLYRFDYTMWSAPVMGQNLLGFSPATLPNRFYSYDSVEDEFTAIANPQNSTFVPGVAYLIRAPNNWAPFSASPGVRYDGKFIGVPTEGPVTVSLNQGFNMVGNPFPCDINAGSVLSQNSSLLKTLYFWRRRNNIDNTGPTTSFYATYTSAGGVGIFFPGQTEIEETKPKSILKVGQGFLVKSDAAATMTFTRTMKRNNNFNDVFLKTNGANTAIEEDGVERHKFYLNLTGGPGIGGQLLLAYAGDASDSLDDSDGEYIGDSEIALTSIIGDQSYVIQGKALPFATNDEIGLRFQTSVAASYTIALEDVTGMFTENVDPLLVDLLTNTTTNLRNASYSFASEIGIFDERFKVVFEETALSTVDVVADVNAVVVMSKNNVLTIDAGSYAISNVEIYDMLGRKIYSKSNVDATSTIISDLRAQDQIILIQIATDHGIVTKKVQF